MIDRTIELFNFLLTDLNSTLCGDTVDMITDHILAMCKNHNIPIPSLSNNAHRNAVIRQGNYESALAAGISTTDARKMFYGDEDESDATVTSPIPGYALEYVKDNWPDVVPADVRSDCQACSPEAIAHCEFPFDPYGLYTADGEHSNTGPLCLK